MSFGEILFLAMALAVDAVSVAIVITMKERCSIRQMIVVSTFFALFQFLMPLVGWALLVNFQNIIASFASWIAFTLLAFVGGKMLFEGLSGRIKGPCKACSQVDKLQNNQLLNLWVLVSLSIATSLDALAVGASFASLGIAIIFPATIIGLLCFFMTFLAMLISSHILKQKRCISCYANMVGGIMLLGIGIRILFL